MTKILNVALMRHNSQAARKYEDLANESDTAIFAVFAHDPKNPTRVSIFYEPDCPVDHMIKSLEVSLETLRHMNRHSKRRDDLSGLKVAD